VTEEAAEVGQIGRVPAVEDRAELLLALRAEGREALGAEWRELEQAGAAVVGIADALDQAESLQLGDPAADRGLVEAERLRNL
jgi:hypothetical protein